MTIRLRLTLLYSLILAITLTGFSIASYVTVAQDGFNRLVATLASKAERIVSDESFRIDDIQGLAHQFAGPEIFVQTRDGSGVVVDRSPNLGDAVLPLPAGGVGPPLTGSPSVDTVLLAGERRLVYNQPFTLLDGGSGLLQISNSLTDRDRSLGNLRRVLIVGNVLVMVAAFGTGWLVAGIGLRPIFRLAQSVLAIGRTQDFARRIDYAGADDEIGQLAGAFDQMLSRLEDAYRRTEQALQAQKRFVADASHELRTPLTTIAGNLSLLRREPPIRDSDRTAVLGDLAEETDRLIRMVNDLLLLARADGQTLHWQDPVPLQPLLESVEKQIQQWAPGRSVTFEAVSAPFPAAVSILGSEDALKQLLLILLHNAVRHTPPSAQVTVRTAVVDSQVEICVCDTGPGIPAQELPRIFDRFYVVDPARTQNSTGLGLAIARTLVDAQNGELTVSSAAQNGTTFKVTLPCQERLPSASQSS